MRACECEKATIDEMAEFFEKKAGLEPVREEEKAVNINLS